MDIDLEIELDINMQSLTMNDIICQNIEEDDSEVSDTIISDMQMLSIDEKAELMYDLFDNNLDIYSVYSDMKDIIKSKKDPTEYNTDFNSIYYKYNIIRVIGVNGIPNEYCNGEDFDDEDFIYNRFKLSDNLSYLVHNDNTVQEIDTCIINFTDDIISPENVYYKILYIYQFVHYYYTTLNELKPKVRLNHLPIEFLSWVDNIVSIIRNTIDTTNMDTSLCVFQKENENQNKFILENLGHYFKDLAYGMSLCVCHLKMILNHHRVRNINLWDMEAKYIEKFFRVLNNLCIIVIYMKHGF
jgi:hypothetical protein